MKAFARWIAGFVLIATPVLPAHGAFTSFYVFGDGMCTTTNNNSQPTLYYGKRFTNGRTWVEVLTQWQGLTYDPAKNWSYFGHDSLHMPPHVTSFVAPGDVNTALFCLWANDADFVFWINSYATTAAALATWTNSMNRSLATNLFMIQTLYNKGVRTLIMPNAVDVTKTYQFSGLSAAAKTYIRQRILDYNAGFVLKLNQARATLPGLTIYAPDTFSLLDDMVANPSHYGLVHPEIDALDDHSFTDKSLNGPGATYLFWDYSDPSAKGHMVLADVIQHLLSTVVLTKITVGGGNSQVYMSNIPVGRNGVVDGTADFLSWNADANFSSLSLSQSVSVPQSGRTLRFYRLRFPFLWTWP